MKFLKDYWGLMLAVGCFIAYIFYSKSKIGNGMKLAQANEKPAEIPDPIERPRPDIDDFGTHPSAEIKPLPPIVAKPPIVSKPRVTVRPPVQDMARPLEEEINLGRPINTTTIEEQKSQIKFAVSKSVYALD